MSATKLTFTTYQNVIESAKEYAKKQEKSF